MKADTEEQPERWIIQWSDKQAQLHIEPLASFKQKGWPGPDWETLGQVHGTHAAAHQFASQWLKDNPEEAKRNAHVNRHI